MSKSGKKLRPLDFVITAIILLAFVFITTVLGGSLLKFLGMEYDSFWSVFLFFIIYFVVDFPADLLVEVFTKLLQSMGRLKRGFTAAALYAVLDIPINCFIMALIDFFMDSVSMPFPAIAVFSVVVCGLNLFLARLRGGGNVRVFLWEQKGEDKVPSGTLLMEVLSLYCGGMGLPFDLDDVKIQRGPHGKPAVCKRESDRWVPRDDLFFSISHTDRWWVCAVYSEPIGADIEERGRMVNEAVAERFFTKEEQEWLSKKGNTRDHFLELWVRKEAYVKYLGTGISEGFRSFSTVRDGELSTEVGDGEKSTFCSFLFPEEMLNEEGLPVPLTGAFCTQYEPKGIEIGFLERSAEPMEWED